MYRCIHILLFFLTLFGDIFFLPYSLHATSISNQDVYIGQKRLIELGYNPGPTDGLLGKKTRAAILQFQQDQGLSITGSFDPSTQEKLGVSDNSVSRNDSFHQITPAETIGTCLEAENLFQEYQKNSSQFNEQFNEIPLCISGYTNLLSENTKYFYIDFVANNVRATNLETTLKLQCRIEKLNELHRQLLKQSLILNQEEKIHVKGIYQSSTDLSEPTLILDQCYLIQIVDRND
jgi:peptidoglycan hydrolase-like protein with peptidoglycan-binding domain